MTVMLVLAALKQNIFFLIPGIIEYNEEISLQYIQDKLIDFSNGQKACPILNSYFFLATFAQQHCFVVCLSFQTYLFLKDCSFHFLYIFMFFLVVLFDHNCSIVPFGGQPLILQRLQFFTVSLTYFSFSQPFTFSSYLIHFFLPLYFHKLAEVIHVIFTHSCILMEANSNCLSKQKPKPQCRIQQLRV